MRKIETTFTHATFTWINSSPRLAEKPTPSPGRWALGHLDEFWPDVKDSRWIGGDAEAWERFPYWLDGAVPLAFILNDEQINCKSNPLCQYHP